MNYFLIGCYKVEISYVMIMIMNIFKVLKQWPWDIQTSQKKNMYMEQMVH